MPARRMKVEVYDEAGNRYTITFDGRVTREKAIRLFDLIELLGGVPKLSPKWVSRPSNMSKFDKVHWIVNKHFPVTWFSSKDILSMYEQEFKEPISLSTVSTYLSRMVSRGILAREGTRSSRRYRGITEITRLSEISSYKSAF